MAGLEIEDVLVGGGTATIGSWPPAPSVGFVGTYPPTRCGIATFTYALRRAMALRVSGVIAVAGEAAVVRYGNEVAGCLVPGSKQAIARAADLLNGWDVAIIQHEFGIYGGEDGEEILELLARLEVPTVVVLHTVARAPSANQRAIMEKLGAVADLLVVQSLAAHRRLLEVHDVDSSRVRVVPHGAVLNLASAGEVSPRWPGRRSVLTWGLLGRDKGIEFGIEAMAMLCDLNPAPRYVVLGETHPRVVEHEGEAYRESLTERALQLGVEEIVVFCDSYLDTAAVLAHVRDADAVLMPYRSREQVVSGVLVEAIASGKPVIATRFPHAEELLGSGSGVLVPHEDAAAIAAAIRRIFTEPGVLRRMAAVARRQAPDFAWEHVGAQYREFVSALHRPRLEGAG